MGKAGRREERGRGGGRRYIGKKEGWNGKWGRRDEGRKEGGTEGGMAGRMDRRKLESESGRRG